MTENKKRAKAKANQQRWGKDHRDKMEARNMRAKQGSRGN